MNIKQIIEAILDNRIWITDHADEEAEEDQLSFDEIYHSVLYGEIIEDYTNHQPYPRCLIHGENFAHAPVHTVWDYDQETNTAILVRSLILQGAFPDATLVILGFSIGNAPGPFGG